MGLNAYVLEPPFHSCKKEARPYIIDLVSPAAPYVIPTKSLPSDWATPTSCCQPSQFWVQDAVPELRSVFVPFGSCW